MRLLQSVMSGMNQIKKPQQKFLMHLMGLLLMIPGHVTFRNLSRYSPYDEKTFSRWYARDFVSLNKAAITEVIPSEHEQVLDVDDFRDKYGKMLWKIVLIVIAVGVVGNLFRCGMELGGG